MRFRTRLFLFLLLPLSTNAFASELSNGAGGINSLGTGLDGSNVLIGQYEEMRSGKVDYDNDPVTSPNTDPFNVRFGNSAGIDLANSGNAGEHATIVAQVMVGKDEPDEGFVGVAPNARLHSLATLRTNLQDNAIALDALADLNLPKSATENGTIVAINLSFDFELTPFVEEPNGNSFFTQFVDWSATFHDVLYVAAWGNSDRFNAGTPSDNFNGITVASSMSSMGITYDKFDGSNKDVNNTTDATGDRVSIDVLAPGSFVEVLGLDNMPELADGTSVAAPHVTGTVALLHQHADTQIAASNPRFHPGRSRRHELMKAVILNSADKLDGVHGSERTIEDLDSVDWDWTQSPAFSNPDIALDREVGAGHLNAGRALEQLKPGEHGPGMVPLIGWDIGESGGQGDMFEYVFDEPLTGGEYIAITLTWDRENEKTTSGGYKSGDTFINQPLEDTLSDLNIYLMEVNETDLSQAVARSTTTEDNVEHIFSNNIVSGEYKIVVEHKSSFTGLDQQQDFALAWWFGDLPEPLAGDYDSDGDVDADDYGEWKMDFGTSVAAGSGADGNGDGTVNLADYTVWRDNLGATTAATFEQTATPEPSAVILCCIAALVICGCKRQRAAA